MQDFEQLGVFYLGKHYDMAAQKPREDLLLYDAKDLTTHSVCVGMTGSGKTGLCLSLLEEAAIDGVPAIAIDPKGDLGNLLLAFPKLEPGDFRPWVDPAEAVRKGLTPDQLAEQTANLWKKGLGDWGEDGTRIQRYLDSVEMSIYTPGSNSGIPLTVLRSFGAPPAAVMNDADALRERINGAVAGLLALLGMEGDPLKSREHILISTLLDRAWREGRDLDLATMIRDIQQPPIDRVGLIDLETFYPAKERFALAMSLNNILASPGFSAWMQGESLDIQKLFYQSNGKPRLSIISIAHLSDSERMFFVTILLNEVLAWMRSQPGTSSLRALLYMDEVFGYFPPTANPPSKLPMLTLLKQARAFGLGVVLATQNPVDLDYKGLSNAGTWFLGRLQTERDKMRVLEGLEGASASAGKTFDRQKMEQTLAGLGNRVFLMNNVHDDAPVVFQTRWTLSYLRGPLSREQIQTLMKDRKAALPPPTASPMAQAAKPIEPGGAGPRPMLPPEVKEVFLTSRSAPKQGEKLVYQPALLGQAKVHFAQSKSGVDEWREVTVLADVDGESATWDSAEAVEEVETESSPADGSLFAALPKVLSQAKSYKSLTTALQTYLYQNERLTLWSCPALKETSKADESESDFRIRISQSAKEARDLAVEKLRQKYAPKLASLEESLRKSQQKVEKEKADSTSSMMTAAITFGSTLLGALVGRKLSSTANVTRAATSMRSAGTIMKKRGEVAAAEQDVAVIQEKAEALSAEMEEESNKLRDQFSAERLDLEEIVIQPKKTEITIKGVMLAWKPGVA
jgi:hypothetical protein